MPLDDHSASVPPYPVETDSTPWESVTVETRRVAEEETMAAIRARLRLLWPEMEIPEQMQGLIDGSGRGFQRGATVSVAGTADEELSRLFGILGSIRLAGYLGRGDARGENQG